MNSPTTVDLTGVISRGIDPKSSVMLNSSNGAEVILRGESLWQLKHGDRVTLSGNYTKVPPWKHRQQHESQNALKGIPADFDPPTLPQIQGVDVKGGEVFVISSFVKLTEKLP